MATQDAIPSYESEVKKYEKVVTSIQADLRKKQTQDKQRSLEELLAYNNGLLSGYQAILQGLRVVKSRDEAEGRALNNPARLVELKDLHRMVSE